MCRRTGQGGALSGPSVPSIRKPSVYDELHLLAIGLNALLVLADGVKVRISCVSRYRSYILIFNRYLSILLPLKNSGGPSVGPY